MPAVAENGFSQMRVSKVTPLSQDGKDNIFCCCYVVLDEPGGDRHLVIQIGSVEASAMAANLAGQEWARPMTYQFMAALVRGLGGQVRVVWLDRVVDGVYAATVEVDGPAGTARVDARSSDALNLAVLVHAPIFVAPEMLDDCARRMEGDSPEAVMARRALTADPVTFRRMDG
jgi:bifunctional DNase/RNase